MKKLIFYTILIFFLLFFIDKVSASTESEIRQQINETNEQIELLDKEIANYQSQISKTSAEKDSLSKIITELTLTRQKLIKERQQIQDKILKTGLVIKDISNDIYDKEKSIEISQKTLSETLKKINQNDNMPIMERLLSVDDFKSLSREYNNLISLNQKLKESVDDISQKRDLLVNSKTKKENEQQNLNNLKKDLVQKEQVVIITKNEKDSLLKETKSKESEYQKILLERQKQRDAFEKQLSDYESQLKFILNPKSLPKEGSHVLSWPLDNVYITQLFGVTSASKRLYKSGSHSGVDFRASIGTPVRSMASGVVEGVGDTDIYCKGASFGKWVFIKYNNGLSSTFGHLSVISAKKGDIVKAGDVVGLSGNTGHTTGPHLHVTVYASDGAKVDSVPSITCSGKSFIMPIAATSAYLDPMLYLPSIISGMLKPGA